MGYIFGWGSRQWGTVKSYFGKIVKTRALTSAHGSDGYSVGTEAVSYGMSVLNPDAFYQYHLP